MIDPFSIEAYYPESVVTHEDGTKYCRIEIITVLLLQAIKEMHEDFSIRINNLETKLKG